MERPLNIFDSVNGPISQLTGDYFKVGWQYIHSIYTKAVSSQIFSGKSVKETEHMQDILFLYLLLILLNIERKEIYEITGSMPTREDLYNSYNLDEVRKYFACNFIEIVLLLAEFDTEIPIGLFDGIGYMQIETGNPQFIIS